MKVCAKCLAEKPLAEFYDAPTTKCGKKSSCIECYKAQTKVRVSSPAGRASAAVRMRRWRAANPGRAKELDRQYRKAHVDRRAAYFARWWAENGSDPDRRARASTRSLEWKRRNPQKRRDHGTKREALERGARTAEVVDRVAVYERDGYLCWLCDEPTVPGSDDHGARPSLDHVIPLADGGPHTAENVRTAHHSCNARRGARDRWARERQAA
jgi:5-methylcytosine-specific restriction endonuclease McrA